MLSNRAFDILKWVCMIVLPSCATLYSGLAEVWALPLAAEVPKTIMLADTFLGALLGVSTIKYKDETQTPMGE